MIGNTIGKLYDRCVEYYPNKIAVVKERQQISYHELKEMAYKLANALLNLGIHKGERVAVLVPNCVEYIICDYALAKCGLVRVPLRERVDTDSNVYVVVETEPSILIYHETLTSKVEEMRPRLNSIKHFVSISEESKVPPGDLHFNKLISTEPSTEPQAEVAETDVNAIYYTGGTTGVPKGVVLTNRAWLATIVTEMLELGLGKEDVFAHLAPINHASGMFILPILLRGGTNVLFDGFTPQSFLEAVERDKVTATFVVPTMLNQILDYPDLRKYDFSSLKTVVYGAAPISPERLKKALAIFGPILSQLFGQTEAPMMIAVLPKEDHILRGSAKEEERLASCGRPTVIAQVRLVDDEDNDVPLGEVGEIVVRSPNVMVEYYKKPEMTAETLRNGWLHTGDLARQDEEGYIYIVDRKKDMIISGGVNIFPREIEDILHKHPAVADVAVIGVPDDKWGEAVKAVVTLHPNKSVTAQELIDFCKKAKGSLTSPKSVDFVDSIPLTPLSKHDKKALREKYWKGLARRVH